MGMRIHSAPAKAVAVEYASNDRLVEVYDDEMDGVGPALIIEDAGNLEALVLSGTPEEVRAFLLRALAATDGVPTMDVDFSDEPARGLSSDEQAYLAHACELEGCKPDDGDLFVDDANIYWWDSPYSTSYDLTNGMRRSRSIEGD